jgi:hypothetical protein
MCKCADVQILSFSDVQKAQRPRAIPSLGKGRRGLANYLLPANCQLISVGFFMPRTLKIHPLKPIQNDYKTPMSAFNTVAKHHQTGYKTLSKKSNRHQKAFIFVQRLNIQKAIFCVKQG